MKFVKFYGIVTWAITIPLDIYTIYSEIQTLRGNKPNEFIAKLRELADIMRSIAEQRKDDAGSPLSNEEVKELQAISQLVKQEADDLEEMRKHTGRC